MKNHSAIRVSAAALAAALVLLCCACGGPREDLREDSTDVFAMDTFMTFRIGSHSRDNEETLRRAVDIVTGLDNKLSATRPGSEIYELNGGASSVLSPDTAALVAGALDFCAQTGGALDITVGPLVRAWGFTSGDYRVPGDGEIADLLEKVDYRAVTVDAADGSVALPDGAALDLGAVAKGYAGDRVIEMLRGRGVDSAIIDLGGNVQTLGSRPDGSPWRVAVRDPLDGASAVGVVAVSGLAVVTTGGYERNFTGDDGVTYCHVIDPATGRPVDNDLLSVTVVGASGFDCDALSTALFVMGEQNAAAFLARHSADFPSSGVGAVIVTSDRRVLVTSNISPVFEFSPDSGYEMEIID